MEYKGIIEKVYYSGNNWASIRVKLDNGKTMNAAGKISFPVEGYRIVMNGKIIKKEDYGEQIDVMTSTLKKSTSETGIKAFLSSGWIKGIGPSTADKIYAKFGRKSLSILKDSPEKLLEIKGITKKKLNQIVSSYQEGMLYEELYTCLKGSITKGQAIKIVKKYGINAVKKVKQNPYCLIYDIDGIGFLKADVIAKSMGVKPNSKNRVGAALVYILKTFSEMNGHCYSDLETLENEGLNLLCPIPTISTDKKIQKEISATLKESLNKWDSVKENFFKTYKIEGQNKKKVNSWISTADEFLTLMGECLEDEIEACHIVYEYNENDYFGERIYLKELYDAEVKSAEIVKRMTQEKAVKAFSLDEIKAKIIDTERMGTKLGEEQELAIMTSLSNRLSIITGGPGRGKTTVIKTILDIWDDDENVILCAPTGRAAQRMKESTGRLASTIHRGMIYTKEHNVKDKLIIIDESSMLDMLLAYQVLEYSKDCQLVFVGDVDQLPSVGPGNFFRDMINSKKVPVTVLKTCYRNAGAIAENASLINEGYAFKYLTFNSEFEYIPADKEHVQEKIIDSYKEALNTYEIRDIAVLAPMRQRSNSGTEQLNTLIRDMVNPYDKNNPYIAGLKFRLNDRVMCLANEAKKPVMKAGIEEEGIFNGDCGFISNIKPADNEIEVTFDDGRIALLSINEMEMFTLAYALTIHKSQGTEYKCVIIPMNTEHYIMLQRNLFYTAETRAKEKVILIGEKRAFQIAIRNTEYKMRNSMFRQRIVA